MKVLVDMNLSPEWTHVFVANGWEAIHWSKIGDPRATDHAIMEWAQSNGYVVFTHDLDSGALLTAAEARGPSEKVSSRTQASKPPLLAGAR